MSLSARHIALQGLGAGVLSLALQGLVVTSTAPVISGGGTTIWLQQDVRLALRQRLIDEDDILLLVAACLDGNALH